MSTRINHNPLSLAAQNNLSKTYMAMETAVTRLSSGLRINNAWDDPAGLAISERFRAQIDSIVEAQRNANYNINLITTAEGAMSNIDEMLTRLRALSIQAANGALTTNDRAALDVEYQQLKSEIDRISNTTHYNGKKLLNGDYSANGLKFHVGIFNQADIDYYYVTFNDMTNSALGISGTDLTTTATAQTSIALLDTAILSKDSERIRLGAFVERLQHTISNLQVSHENSVKSESQVRDADIAQEMSAFVRAQILMQSGVAMLSQANLVPQTIAGLIG